MSEADDLAKLLDEALDREKTLEAQVAQLRHTLGFWREAYIEDNVPTEDWIQGTDQELAAYEPTATEPH